MKLSVDLRTAGAVAPGAVVPGNVLVVEGGSSRSLSVSLEYVEQSPDYTHVAVEVPGPVLNSGDLSTGASFEFNIQLPPDALPGQSLPHGRLFWRVHAKSDERGLDTHAFAEVPTGVPAAA